MTSAVDLPLDGVVVADLCNDRAGSVAAMLLADLGADVVRIESADGTHRRDDPRVAPDPVTWDRGKRRLIVGSLDPQSDHHLADALSTADVALVDGAPAAVTGSPLDPSDLSRRFAHLDIVWTPPYGARGGTYDTLPADALLLDGLSGFAMHQPADDPSRPIAPIVPIAEYVHGALAACAAVATLVGRQRGGPPSIATISGLDAVATLLATLVHDTIDTEAPYGFSRTAAPNFRGYRCGDGNWLFLGALTPALFLAALDVLDAADVLQLEGVDGQLIRLFHPARARAAIARLETSFGQRPRQEWLERLAAAGIPAEPVQERATWRHDPEVAGEHARDFDHPVAGPVRAPSPAMRFVDVASGSRREVTGWWPAEANQEDAQHRPGPLSGVRVVDSATFLAGPLAPTLLGHWGADVIKVEAPEGDPYRAFAVSYLAANRGKHTIRLDLRDAGDRRRFESLVAASDVLVDNLRPVTRAALGLDDGVLAEVNQRLVHARVTAFADDGDRADQPGFDPSIQALSGLMTALGGADAPIATTTPVHDVAAGVASTLGILAALWDSHRTGRARSVRSTLAAASTLVQLAELSDWAGRAPGPTGGPDFPGAGGRRFYPAADGWIGMAARSSSELVAAARSLGAPAVADHDACDEITTALATMPVATALARLADSGVPACRVVGADWQTDAYLAANEFTEIVTHPDLGRCRLLRLPGQWRRPTADGTPPC